MPTRSIVWRIAKQTNQLTIEFWRELYVVLTLPAVAADRYRNSLIPVDCERRRTSCGTAARYKRNEETDNDALHRVA